MPAMLPLLLLGGAAVVALGGKKKPRAPKLAPTTPPPIPSADKKATSGYSNVTRERMQEIQTMLISNGYDPGIPDGKYGPKTKQAVWEFQEDWGGLGVDGKPGSKTQAALEEAEQERINALGYTGVKDACDPLNVNTWGAGNICEFDGTKWILRKGTLPKNAVPPISAMQVGFSADYSNLAIGSQFRLGVLDPWLNQRRLDGLLVTKYHGPTLVEYLSKNPTTFLAETFGIGKARGEALYALMFVASTGGFGLGAKAIQKAVVKVGQTVAVKAATYGPLMGVMEKVFGTDAEGAAASAVEAFAEFSKTHYVLVGNKKVKIIDLPASKNSVKSFTKYIMDYIQKFQKMRF